MSTAATVTLASVNFNDPCNVMVSVTCTCANLCIMADYNAGDWQSALDLMQQLPQGQAGTPEALHFLAARIRASSSSEARAADVYKRLGLKMDAGYYAGLAERESRDIDTARYVFSTFGIES